MTPTLLALLVATSQVPTPDSLITLLSAPDWRTRDFALAHLTQLPAERVPARFPAAAIALLEREADSPDTGAARGVGEGYGEYRMHLVAAVVQLDQPRALRGVILVGLGTSRKVRDFVGRQAAAALPVLDEAWSRDRYMRYEVVGMLGSMLGPYGHLLTAADSMEILKQLLRGAEMEPHGFISAAGVAGLYDAIPLLEQIGRSATNSIVKNRAVEVAANLRLARMHASRDELMSRLRRWVRILCSTAATPECQDLSRASVGSLSAFRLAVGRVRGSRQLSPAGLTLLSGNLDYLAGSP